MEKVRIVKFNFAITRKKSEFPKYKLGIVKKIK